MLSIRLQRTGRKGHAQYRVVVQDSRQSPTSGKAIARLGHYDPHTKVVVLDKDKTETFLKNGAQPSPRVVSLLTVEKIAMPAWVKTQSNKRDKAIRNPEKLRRNQPAEEKVAEEAPVAEAAEVPAESADVPVETEAPAEEASTEPAEEVAEKPAEETPAEEPVAEKADTDEKSVKA